MSLIILKMNEIYGFINEEGEMLIRPSLEAVKLLPNGFAAIRKDGKWGFIDSKGNKIVDFIYEDPNDSNT